MEVSIDNCENTENTVPYLNIYMEWLMLFSIRN